jgi:uncharacterized protein (TIGR02145 family)
LAVTLDGWLDSIAAFEVFPIHRIIDVEDNSEEPTLFESRSNRRYQQRHGKYRYNFRTSVPVEWYDRLKAYEGQRLDAIFGDVNGNVIGRGDGDNIKPITVESIMVRKISWGVYGQPCIVGITIDLAYPSQMREVVSLPAGFPLYKAKFDELVIGDMVEVEMPDVINYGLLYNWWALSAGAYGTIVSLEEQSNGWIVPTVTDWDTLITYLGGASVAGGKLKETGLTYWNSPNTGATNEVGFNGRGSGWRWSDFANININLLFWSATSLSETFASYISIIASAESITGSSGPKLRGYSIRPVRPATEAEQLLDDGTACDYYHGTDGKVYRTVKIGTQVWLADNLAETMLPETSYIDGWSAEGYVPISDVDWAAKTSEALCCYNDQITNI